MFFPVEGQSAAGLIRLGPGSPPTFAGSANPRPVPTLTKLYDRHKCKERRWCVARFERAGSIAQSVVWYFRLSMLTPSPAVLGGQSLIPKTESSQLWSPDGNTNCGRSNFKGATTVASSQGPRGD